MALSGTINGKVSNKSDYFSFYMTWSAVQDIVGNYSDVTVKTYWKTSNTGHTFDTTSTRAASITINGTVSSISKRFNCNPWPSNPYLIQTATTRVYHNADGKKSITISASANGKASTYGPSESSASGTITLDTIPRSSSFGTVTGSTIGSSCTVNITRASTSFTHQLWYKVGNSAWYDLGSGIGTSKTFTIDIATCSQFPSATSGTMQLCIRTFNGTTQVGSDVYKNVTVSVPTSVVPTIGNISWTKTSSEPSTWPMTQGVSTGTMSMTGVAGAYGSTISSYKLTFAGLSSSSSSLTVSKIASSGTLQAVATVTDTRGRTAEKKVNFTVSAYSKPQVTATVYRSNSSGGEDSSGDYLYVKATATVSSVGNNSLQSLTFKYKKQTASSYSSVSLTSGTGKIISASSDYTWNWVVVASDRVNSVEVKDDMGTGEVVLDIMSDGSGMGAGKVAELSGVFDFGYKVKFGQGIENIVIPAGTNLNTLLTPNTYKSVNNQTTTYTNKPSEVSSSTFTLEVMSGGDSSQVLQRLTTCDKTSPRIFVRLYHSSSWGSWIKLYPENEDSGWVDAYLASNFVRYDTTNPPIQIRKIGKVVHMRGIVKAVNAVTPTSDASTWVCWIPIAYAPPSKEVFICQGSGSCRFQLTVNHTSSSAGWADVFVSRYTNSTTTQGTIAAGNQLWCNATWFID